MLNPSEYIRQFVEQVRERHHVVNDDLYSECGHCTNRWPCDTHILANALECALEALEWYGGREAWAFHRTPGTFSSHYREVERDKGDKARAAQAAIAAQLEADDEV